MLKTFFCTGILLAGATLLSGASASLEAAGRIAFQHNEKNAGLKIRSAVSGGRDRLSGVPCTAPPASEQILHCAAGLIRAGLLRRSG